MMLQTSKGNGRDRGQGRLEPSGRTGSRSENIMGTQQRVAVVVGGASGIGWATAKALAAQGFGVTIADRNTELAAQCAAELGDPHTWAAVEVSDEDSVAALFDQVGDLDAVVNCAGFSGFGMITDLDAEQFRSVVDVCLTGGFLVIKHAGRHLREGGSVVSLTSLNARQPAIGMSAYCAAKAGLSMLTQVAALELGPRGIRVNAVAPGFVHTPLTEGAAVIPGVVEEYVENTALGRVGTPEDVAAAVAFLCSPQSAWMTGEILDLNGGAHLKRYPNIHQHLTKLMGQ
jgi:3-oxoacyl-[acyl-carrier protein] reductase